MRDNTHFLTLSEQANSANKELNIQSREYLTWNYLSYLSISIQMMVRKIPTGEAFENSVYTSSLSVTANRIVCFVIGKAIRLHTTIYINPHVLDSINFASNFPSTSKFSSL